MLGKANPRGGHISSTESQSGGWVRRAAPSSPRCDAAIPMLQMTASRGLSAINCWTRLELPDTGCALAGLPVGLVVS